MLKKNMDSEIDFELINGVHILNEKKLHYVCNTFIDKDYAKSFFYIEFINFLYKLNEVTFYIEFSTSRRKIFQTFRNLRDDYVDAIDEMNNIGIDFKFNIYYYQKLISESRITKSPMTNGSLFYMRNESKDYFSIRRNLKYEVLHGSYLNNGEKLSPLLDNIVPFFEKFFIFLDSVDGVIKVQTLNQNLFDNEVDYTYYLKITGKHFAVIEDIKIINQEILELLHQY